MDRTKQPILASTVVSATEPGIVRTEPTLLFSAFRLEPDGSLFRGETPIHLPPRELAALRLLVAHAGQIVAPQQIKLSLWGDVHVTSDSVPRCLSSLRALLLPEDCIQTVYKRGYRLLSEVRERDASPLAPLPRLAIPPFITGAGVPEHLGTAVAEVTIARLSNARKPLASVLARDSVFTLAQRGLNAQGIGEALHADLVLVGNLRALISHFRLRIEMIRVADGIQIWAEDFLVERTNPAGLESDLASRLDFRLQSRPLKSGAGGALGSSHAVSGFETRSGIGSLKGRHPEVGTAVPMREDEPYEPGSGIARGNEPLSISAVAASVSENAPGSMRREAYEVFLRGHHEWQTLERHRMQDGLQHLTKAIELDSSLLAAKVDLVHLCVAQSLYGFMSPSTVADLVHRTADSIPGFPHQAGAILPALAWVNFHFDRNLPAALWAFQLSNHLPHDPWVTRVRAMFALSRRLFNEAIVLLRAAIELDPFSPWLNTRLAWALHLDGQALESIEQIEHCCRLFPEHEGTALYGSLILGYSGQPERALQLAKDLVQRQPYFDLAAAVHANALAAAGQTEEARSVLERLQWLSRERFVHRSLTSVAYATLGEFDGAIRELQAANDDRCPWFFQVLADPRLKILHGYLEFQQLEAVLSRMEEAAQNEGGAGNGPGKQA